MTATQEFFSADHRDALQEISNVAMGSAGAGLATVLDSFVHLSIPKLSLVDSDRIASLISEGCWANQSVSAVRQAFYNRMSGEAIALFGAAGCRELADLMGHEGDIEPGLEQELLLDVSNILVGACLNGLAAQLQTQFGFSAPSILCEDKTIAQLFSAYTPVCKEALLIQIDFAVEARSFTCQLLIFMPRESLELLHEALTRFLESI
jgi:chemotaxis protein CheC